MYIVKVYRQHGSTVMTVPVNVRRYLQLQAGDYVVLEETEGTSVILMSKFVKESLQSGQKHENIG